MSLKIIKPGICDTLQDEGRKGFQHLGINPGGVMDKEAAQMVNLLAGNAADTAVLEMHFPAAAIAIEEPCLLVIGGADFTPEINGRVIPLLQPVKISAPAELRFRQRCKGCWCYLAVYGGFDVAPWMNSYATNLKARAGGWKGRVLQKNDRIPFRRSGRKAIVFSASAPEILPWRAVPIADPTPDDEVWIVEGKEWKTLDEDSRRLLASTAFSILPASDRMGYSLDGPELRTIITEPLISSAVDFGTLQLLPDGQLMILMADHQTTGGYPRLAHVIKPHLPKLAQQNAGNKVRFSMVSQAVAAQLWLQHYRHLEQLKYACRFKMDILKLQQ